MKFKESKTIRKQPTPYLQKAFTQSNQHTRELTDFARALWASFWFRFVLTIRIRNLQFWTSDRVQRWPQQGSLLSGLLTSNSRYFEVHCARTCSKLSFLPGVCVCVCVCIYIYIHTYIHTERERERERDCDPFVSNRLCYSLPKIRRRKLLPYHKQARLCSSSNVRRETFGHDSCRRM